LLTAQNLARAFFSQLETSGYRLKPKTLKPVVTSPQLPNHQKSLLKSTAKKSAAA
jgi:hypothetical protein